MLAAAQPSKARTRVAQTHRQGHVSAGTAAASSISPSGKRESRAWPQMCLVWHRQRIPAVFLAYSSTSDPPFRISCGSSPDLSLELNLEGYQSNLPRDSQRVPHKALSQTRGYFRFTYLCIGKRPWWALEICQELQKKIQDPTGVVPPFLFQVLCYTQSQLLFFSRDLLK